MGLFHDIFGKKVQLPALDPSAPASERMGRYREQLDSFASKVNDKLEALPSDDALYIFVGKPPGSFGVAWLKEGKEKV